METLPSHEAFRGTANLKALNFTQLIEFMRIVQIRGEWEAKVRSDLMKEEIELAETFKAVAQAQAQQATELIHQANPYLGKVENVQTESDKVFGSSMTTFVTDPKVTQAMAKLCDYLANKWILAEPSKASDHKADTDRWPNQLRLRQELNDAFHAPPWNGCPPDLRSALIVNCGQHEIMLLWSVVTTTETTNERLLVAHTMPIIDREGALPVDGSIRYWESLERNFYYSQRANDMIQKCISEILQNKPPTEEQLLARRQSWLKWCEMMLQQA